MKKIVSAALVFVQFTPSFAQQRPSTPPLVDLEQPAQVGRRDGNAQGRREANDRGPFEGGRLGRVEGTRRGRERCEREDAERARAQGFDQGLMVGRSEGEARGRQLGEAQGRIDGANDGANDGRQRADRDATTASLEPATRLGEAQANDSDATQRGTTDGTALGQQQAEQRARDVDFPAGREEYRRERFAETPQSQDQFRQHDDPSNAQTAMRSGYLRQSVAKNSMSDRKTFLEAPARECQSAFPDFRYASATNPYTDPNQNRVYAQAFREGYSQGFRFDYSITCNRSFDFAFREGERFGCEQAHQQDYSVAFYRGQQEGRLQGADVGYQNTFEPTRLAFRNAIFPGASNQAYQENYQAYYASHFESARQAAYAARVGQLYEAAKEAARQHRFDEVYPGAAAREHSSGRTAELADFQARPVRLLDATVIESNPNSVYEPGELLRLRLHLRNFAGAQIAAGDVRIQIRAADNRTILSESDAALVRGLRTRSLTTVVNAMEFRFPESMVNGPTQIFVTAIVRGRESGQIQIDLTPKYFLRLQLAAQPSLREGMPMPIRIQVTNQASVPTDAQSTLTLLTRAALIEVAQPSLSVGIIQPGETRVFEFSAIARTTESQIHLPLAFVAAAGGARLGALSLESDAPIVNEYRIRTTTNTSVLRTPGVRRVGYSIVNAGSGLIYSSLQLRLRFVGGADSNNFTVIGPNPQFSLPLDRGQALQFVFPVMARQGNGGGTLELEVFENGQTTVVHQLGF